MPSDPSPATPGNAREVTGSQRVADSNPAVPTDSRIFSNISLPRKNHKRGRCCHGPRRRGAHGPGGRGDRQHRNEADVRAAHYKGERVWLRFGVSQTVTVDFSTTREATAATSSTGTFSASFTVPKWALTGPLPPDLARLGRFWVP